MTVFAYYSPSSQLYVTATGTTGDLATWNLQSGSLSVGGGRGGQAGGGGSGAGGSAAGHGGLDLLPLSLATQQPWVITQPDGSAVSVSPLTLDVAFSLSLVGLILALSRKKRT